MSTPNPSLIPQVPQADLDEALELFERANGEAFTRVLAQAVFDPTPAQQAALRDPRLITKSIAGVRRLIDKTNADLKDHPLRTDRAWRSRAEAFRTKMGEERRLLEAILAEYREAQGSIAESGLRARAKNELWHRHPEEGLAILRDLQERQKAERALEREHKKAERLAERQQQGRVYRAERLDTRQ